ALERPAQVRRDQRRQKRPPRGGDPMGGNFARHVQAHAVQRPAADQAVRAERLGPGEELERPQGGRRDVRRLDHPPDLNPCARFGPGMRRLSRSPFSAAMTPPAADRAEAWETRMAWRMDRIDHLTKVIQDDIAKGRYYGCVIKATRG